MMKVKIIDTDMGICIETISNVFRIETDPDDMTCKIGFIEGTSGDVAYKRIKVGPKDTNKVVVY